MGEHVKGCGGGENNPMDESCPRAANGFHCIHWYDAEPCCACGAPACPACLAESEGDVLDAKETTDV